MAHKFLITGCSGGGKSTLLAILSDLGFPVVEEAGRRVVAKQEAAGGSAFPWSDMAAFLREVETMAAADIAKAVDAPGPVFFDRGLLDTVAAYEFHLGDHHAARRTPFRDLTAYYAKQVFIAPPWPEIYVNDAVRQHDFELAVREYEYTLSILPRLGFELVFLPLSEPQERARFVLSHIGEEWPHPNLG